MLPAGSRTGSRAVAGALTLALGALLGSPAAAQAPSTPAAAGPETPPARALPYALNEVAVQASNELLHIDEILARIAVQRDEREYVEHLSRFNHEILRGGMEVEDALARDYSRNEVEELRARWDAIDADLEAPQQLFDARILAAEAFLAELRTAESRWQATLVGLDAVEAPTSVRSNVENTLAAAVAARATIEKRRDVLLARQAHCIELRATVAGVMRRLDAAESQMFQLAFQRNRSPIWSSIHDPRRIPTGTALLRLQQGEQAIARYLRHHLTTLCLQGIALLALIWLGWNARNAALRRQPGTPLAELPLALRHPIASALLLVVAPVPWTYTYAPFELTRLFTLAVLPAWLILLRSFLPAGLHRTVTGLAVIVLFEILREVVGTAFAARQFVLAIELTVSTLGVLWLRRPARIAAAAPLLGAGGWVRVLDLWLRLGALLLPIGAIASVAGYVMAAEAVLRFYVGGSYLAGLLMLASELAEELTRAWLQGGALDFLYMIRRGREQVLAVLRRGYRIAASLTWLIIVFRNQGVLSALINAVKDASAWQIGYGSMQITAGGTIVFVATLWLGWVAGRFVFFVLEQEIFARLGLPRGVPYALATLSQYAVTTVAFLLALSTLGVGLEKVSILMGALGVGIGFGLQNAVSNFISGLILLFERPIHVGDRLQLEDVTGLVTHIGIRASRLRTVEGADVIVPNSDLISTRVTNWTLADRMRMVTIPIGVGYGSDLRRTLEVLGEVARTHPDVHPQPAPDALFVGFGESSLDFEVRIFADADRFASVRSQVGVSIAEALNAAGIEIPFPQRDLHLRSVDESIRVSPAAGGLPNDREPNSSG